MRNTAVKRAEGDNQPQGLRPAAEYLPFVRRIALRLLRRLPSHIQLDDLVGAGLIGLLEAMQRYDAERMPAFETYAEFRVKGAMLDELRGRDLMARDARTESKRIETAIADLTRENSEAPDERAIAARLGLSIEDLRAKLQRLTPVQVLSLNNLNVVDEPTSWAATPFDEAVRSELLERLRVAITKLPDRHQKVFHLYYREELTMRDIGKVLGVTESRVCQIVSEGTLRLRAMLHDHGAPLVAQRDSQRRTRKR